MESWRRALGASGERVRAGTGGAGPRQRACWCWDARRLRLLFLHLADVGASVVGRDLGLPGKWRRAVLATRVGPGGALLASGTGKRTSGRPEPGPCRAGRAAGPGGSWAGLGSTSLCSEGA